MPTANPLPASQPSPSFNPSARSRPAGLARIEAARAKGLLDRGEALLIDIRESDEFAREHLPGAHHVPLSAFNAADFPADHDKIAIFHCASGARTAEAAPRILATAFAEVYQLEQGLSGWKKAGLPTVVNRAMPISIQRQVQITAGMMVLIGVVLGFLVSPWFFALSGFVGAGLTFAGISGTCAMASLLAVMPWNRRALA
jgi:rhodanese-related sulfurtransferase